MMIDKLQNFYSHYPHGYNIDVTEDYWIAILKEEDRLIDNSDRKYRYHCKSLESMSEELAFQERYISKEEDFMILCDIQDFTCLVQNEELAPGYGLLPPFLSCKKFQKIF